MRDDDILTTGDAAKLLDLTSAGVQWLDRQGQLPSKRTVSGRRLFLRKDVMRLATKRARAGAASDPEAA